MQTYNALSVDCCAYDISLKSVLLKTNNLSSIESVYFLICISRQTTSVMIIFVYDCLWDIGNVNYYNAMSKLYSK